MPELEFEFEPGGPKCPFPFPLVFPVLFEVEYELRGDEVDELGICIPWGGT